MIHFKYLFFLRLYLTILHFIYYLDKIVDDDDVLVLRQAVLNRDAADFSIAYLHEIFAVHS